MAGPPGIGVRCATMAKEFEDHGDFQPASASRASGARERYSSAGCWDEIERTLLEAVPGLFAHVIACQLLLDFLKYMHPRDRYDMW